MRRKDNTTRKRIPWKRHNGNDLSARVPFRMPGNGWMHRADAGLKIFREDDFSQENILNISTEPGEFESSERPCNPQCHELSEGVDRSETLKGEEERTREAKRRKWEKAAVTAVCLIILMSAAGFFYYRLPYYCVQELTVEAGTPWPSVSDFLKWECSTAYIVSGIDESKELDHVQDYEVVLHLYHQNVSTMLHVTDTTAPVVRTENKTIMLGEEVSATDFVVSVEDVTQCEIGYRQEADLQRPGAQTVLIEVTDEGANVTAAEAELTILQDVTPPLIEGVKELTIKVGESVSYKKNITVTDDYDDNVSLMVDHSEVDVDKPGDYPVTYSAVDKYGNEAKVSTILHVEEPKQPVQNPVEIPMTEEAVNAEADRILASITNPAMTQYDIIKAIYDWCHSKIAFVNDSPKNSWVEGAYYGLVRRKGDCYAYAMSAKCLLTRAGIVNMDIERIRYGNGMHFWNLVDIGEGWRHFDTCRRADGATFFYLTDAELMEYSEAHTAPDYPYGTHYYDRTLYPEIP